MPKPQQSKPPSSDSAVLPSEMSSTITHYIRAGYPGLYVVSAEELRVEAEFKSITERLNYGLHFWSVEIGRAHV